MKQSKNYLTLSLMISSIVLLVALQVLWLNNSYEKAYADLRSETSRLLRGAVVAVRDSALLQTIEALPPDSLAFRNTIIRQQVVLDSSEQNVPIERHSSQAQVFVSSNTSPDSARLVLRSLATQMQEGRIRGNSQFIIRFSRDSLNIDSIRTKFGSALAKAKKLTRFEIKKVKVAASFTRTGTFPVNIGLTSNQGDSDERFILANDLQSEWVRVDPTARYATVLFDIRPMLLGEITPQILFGLFLTLLTIASFVFMYRSILSQQRLMIIKNDFISNITHELKTPIATVSVALEALKNFKGIQDPKLTSEYLDIAQNELGRLSILTDKVLTTSLFDERGVSLDFQSVDLENAITTIISSMKLVLEKHKALVSFEKTGTNFTVEGSSVHLINVIHNLLDNALKYSPTEPKVIIALQEQGDHVIFSMTDKGLGIPSLYHKKVFEKFFRMPTGDVHNIKGYGLGLSYVDQVVRGHHGTIAIKSAPGEGSTFAITLPKYRR